jgi:ABC-type glycerol-3-phosphate transport system permease component
MRARTVLIRSRQVLFNLFAWAVVLLIAFPLFWMIVTSLKPETELFTRPPTFFPIQYTLANYERLLFDTHFPVFFMNSSIVALGTTILVIVVATLGAHSLVTFRYRGRRLLAQAVLFTYLLPSVILVIPLYMVMARLGLVNSLFGLVICYATFALPFALWLLRSFMVSIPLDLESAAMIDGASRIRAFIDVILPQALPGIISTALFTFIVAWNEYLFALVLINRQSSMTLPVGVFSVLINPHQIEWGLMMTASVMMSVPLIIAFSFLQKHLTRGFGAGAVKG